MDLADLNIDGKINLASSYRFPNSFRIDGFELFQINIFTSSVQESVDREPRSYFLPFLNAVEPQSSHLIDLRHLAVHDSVDGETDGVVASFDTSADYSWSFPKLGLLSVCKPDTATDREKLIGSLHRVAAPVSASNPLDLIVFDTLQLASLDRIDGTADRSIGLDTVLEQKIPDVWHLSFGELVTNVLSAYIGCAGDFDGDGHEDILMALTHVDGLLTRAHIILLSYADLASLDRLDGEADYQVDVELLWPSE